MKLKFDKISVLLLVFLVFVSFGLYSETLKFKIKYLGLSVIEIDYRNETENSLISISAESTGIAGALYDVSNKYLIEYKDDFLPITYRKIINENDYAEDRKIEYDRETGKAVRKNLTDKTEISYGFVKDTRDFFSSLMMLRKTGNQNGKFFVDAAGKIWEVSYKNIGKDRIKSCLGKLNTCKFELSFRPVDEKKKEKSDLLTSNIVNHKRFLYFWFTDDDRRIPVRAKFTSEPFAVSWILTEYKK